MVELDSASLREMVEHGLRELPIECCGLIAGRNGAPVKVFALRNADASPSSYRLDPEEQLRVFEQIDEEGWELLAIYHSHTHSEAYPSETDRRLAFYPDASYLVVSLSDRQRPAVRAFRILEGEVVEEELTVT
ncbi:MAG: M67 family metallopeptidase [Actinomycetota bacterium]